MEVDSVSGSSTPDIDGCLTIAAFMYRFRRSRRIHSPVDCWERVSIASTRTWFQRRYSGRLSSTPPWRMHREYRNSVSQFSKLADPRTSRTSASEAAVSPWTPVKVRILETTAGLATSKAVFTSKLAMKAVLHLNRPGCRSTRLSSRHSQCR